MPGQQDLPGDLAALGPFFAVETHVPGQAPSPPWQPMATLTEHSAALDARVHAVRTALAHRAQRQPADIALRVTASVAHLGLIARLLAPAIGAIALRQTPISLRLGDLWWQDQLGGPYPLSVAPEAGTHAPALGPAVEAITATVAERYRVSDHVLWGNIGSAANSSARLISAARPDRASAAHATADHVLADPRVDDGILRAGPNFRRRSCCLIYRVADDRTAICGDCILG